MAAHSSLVLTLKRDLDLPLEAVWRAWTDPDWLVRWFTPAPWTTSRCELELRPGGRFLVVMRSPEGEEAPQEGCVLEVVPGGRLVWTSALRGGYVPAPPADFPPITVTITLEALEDGTRYTATVDHPRGEDRERHEAMGFHQGWGAALDQLVALVKAGGPGTPEPTVPEA